MYKQHFLLITRLGFPIVVAQLGTIITGFADTMMVGLYGTNELSAAGFTNNVFGLVIYFLLGFSYSTTPVVGAYYGQGKYADAARTLKESLVANIGACVVVVALMTVLYYNLHHMGQPDELLPLIRPYFLVVLASMPFVSVFNSLKQFCDGVGDTKMPMWIMIGGNVLNIFGNYMLIFGKLGCPELGLVGAGLSTLFARIVMVVAMLFVIFKTRRYAVYRSEELSGEELSSKELSSRELRSKELSSRDATCGVRGRGGVCPSFTGVIHLTRKGLPIGLQLCMEASTFSLCGVMMGWIGAVSLAAHQVMCTVSSLCFMVYYGVGAAVAIRISHFRGQGNWDEVRRVAGVGLAMTIGLGVVLSVLIFFLRYPIASMFTTNEEVISVVVALVIPMMFYQIGDCIQIIYSNALRAIEDVKMMMLYAFIAYVVVSIPLSYIFAFTLDMGPVGIWWAFPFGLTTAGVLFWTRFNKTIRRAV